MPPVMDLMVSEVFGPTLQGEGRNLGLPSIFVRTQFCPVGCTWCDTKYTWKFDKTKAMTEQQVVDAIKALQPPEGPIREIVSHIVFTGGEPFAQAEAVARVTNRLLMEGRTIEFETSGAFMPSVSMPDGEPHETGITYNVSPKPPSANVKVPYNSDAIKWFRNAGATFKFVIDGEMDLDWALGFIRLFSLQHNNVYFMPQGTTQDVLQKNLQFLWEAIPRVMPRAHVTPRMHIDAWGLKRGV